LINDLELTHTYTDVQLYVIWLTKKSHR